MTGTDAREPEDPNTAVDWDVSIGPDLPGPTASVVLRLSKDGRTVKHRLDAKTATELSNALIAQAEKAQFKAARKRV
ncbi:MAG: hypothetical protein U1E62_15030 [Alsobacter sp.]